MAVTKSFSVEFDDALLDLEGWKNPRYEGSKLTGQKINEWNAGDITYGKNPVVENKTTALYIGNTLIGGEDEDESYAYIKRHSYVGINRILIIDPTTDDVKLLDSTQEEFEPFHRFITNDLPTGGAFNIRLLDFSTPNSLDAVSKYHVKMNKGWLLKSFKHNHVATNDNNGLFLYSSSSNFMFNFLTLASVGSYWSPSYISSSIIINKHVSQYIAPNHTTSFEGGGSAQEWNNVEKFITASLEYLNNNQTTTELHLTLHDGTYDFAPGFNDERSISTFEVDKKISFVSSLYQCGGASSRIIAYPELTLKGETHSPFAPTISASNPHTITRWTAQETGPCALDIDDAIVYTRGNEYPTGSYSGSYGYELSFLDKAHTLIANIPKERYLPNGIGEKGYVIIPEQTDRRVKDNIDYYLEKAGLIEKTVTAKAPRRGR